MVHSVAGMNAGCAGKTVRSLENACHTGALSCVTLKRYEIGCQLLLITNRKSLTGFRLVPTSMTLNDLEGRNSPILRFFTEFDSFAGRLRHNG